MNRHARSNQKEAESGQSNEATDPRDPAWEAHGRSAKKPSGVPPRGWKDILLRVKSEVVADDISTQAAALAFYGMLAIFPALVALVSVYGLLADPVDVERQLNALAVLLPGAARDVVSGQLHAIVTNSSGSLGLGAIAGIFGALWSASSGVASLIKGINLAYDEKETRGFFKTRGLALLFTIALILFVTVAFALVAVLPGILGVHEGPIAWALSIARWPFLAAGVLLGLGVLYRYAPDRERARWRWVTWGSAIAAVIWLVASIGFSVYVSNFGNYDKTYGAIGGVIVLLLWFYVSSFVILLGAEINSEIEAQTAQDSTDGPPKPLGHRGAAKADVLGEVRTA